MRINQQGGTSVSPDILQKIDSVKQGMGKPIPGDMTSLRGKDYHVLIGFPSRNETCYMGLVETTATMACAFLGVGVEVTLDTYRNGSYPDLPRNYLLKQFVYNEKNKSHLPYTHIMQIDDDMSWRPYEAPVEMMTYGKDFIAGVGPLKRAPRDQAFAASPEGGQDPNSKLLKMINVGGAFIQLSRFCVEKMMEKYKHLNHPSLEGFPTLFERHKTKEQDFGEDMGFCKRWREIGGEIWAYTDIDFEHLGHYVTTGNYKTYLNEEITNPNSKHVTNMGKQTRLVNGEFKQVA